MWWTDAYIFYTTTIVIKQFIVELYDHATMMYTL